ncbi:MAG: GNAT family N-acetyltransferase [Beutenbergiaceae bacterium]
MPHGVSVAVASAEDFPHIVTVLRAARADSPLGHQLCSPESNTLQHQLGAWCALPGTCLLAAWLGDDVVGAALVQRIEANLFSDVTFVQLEALYVDAGSRRRGVGRALMHAVADIAVQGDASHVVTMPLAGSRSEQRFLSRLGFAPVGTRRIVETPALARRLETLAVPRHAKGLEQLIALRRRSRGLAPTPDSGIPVGESRHTVTP